MKNKESYYAVIPANVRYSKKLSSSAKLLYGEITALCNKEGYCWATNSYFAKLYEVNKMTISIWIKSLENSGFIKCLIKDKNKRRIYIREDIEKSIGGYRKIYRGDIEKSISLYNNTNNNKDISVAGKPDDGLISQNIKKTFEHICVITLENLLRSKRKLFRKVNQKQWILYFQKFRHNHGFEKQRIKKVLIWYTKHFGEEFVPQAYSAKSFCDKFLNIENAMERWDKLVEKGEQPIQYRRIRKG